MSDVSDHGLETLKKSAEHMDASVANANGASGDYYHKVGLVIAGNPAMPVSDINPLPVTSSAPAASTPTITNIVVPSANVEVSHSFQPNVRKFSIRARNNARMQFAFNATESSTNFITLFSGSTYTEDGINLTAGVLYFQLNSAPGTVEVLEWN